VDHDPASDEIQGLLRQPMGDAVREAAWALLQRYRRAALEAARIGETREEREAGVRAVRVELLETLRDILPRAMECERRCDEAVREAEERAGRVYRERFEREVSLTLADPAFARPTAERIAHVELHTFRKELAQELAELIGHHRQWLREAIARLLGE
jgi:hypothetical protein